MMFDEIYDYIAYGDMRVQKGPQRTFRIGVRYAGTLALGALTLLLLPALIPLALLRRK